MILVTGGAGFIGSNLAAALAARGDPVVICDRLGSHGKWRNIAPVEVADILAPEALPAFLEAHGDELRAVVHMGAISETTAEDADALVENNFRLSMRLWVFCAARNKQFIYASSAATYGDGARGFDDDASIEHLARLRPLNAYGWSKHTFDRWVARRLADGAARPLQWAGLKFFNVYGPNEQHKGAQASVAWHLWTQVKAGGPARLFRSHHPDYADGGQLRDFVWVGDCVDVVLWLLDNRRLNGLFNVGTGTARSFADLAGAVFAALGQAPRIDYIPTPENIRDRYQYFTEAKMQRLREAGYEQPFTTLEVGVRRYIQDFLAKPEA
ncbi:MAG TPA: ADP-glyceromanno-heptose 6-epimerase [Kiloniellales bacterium]